MKLQHILSTKQFTDRKMLEDLFAASDQMEKVSKANSIPQSLAGKIIACIFYEPSTRSRFSFETAIQKLGGKVVTAENALGSMSAVKGESLEDTIRIICGYDVAGIVLRYHEAHGAARAAAVSSVPVINAGDGPAEHPTQALYDLYTIKKEKGRLHDLKIALVGDLLYGRTVHSLLPLFSLYENIKLCLISPKALALPEEYKNFLRDKHLVFEETYDLSRLPHDIDVVYATRIQKERFDSLEEYEKLKGTYIINLQVLARLSKDTILMHPLPRVDEIDRSVDRDPRAAYFRQAKNGLYVRMALLQEILK